MSDKGNSYRLAGRLALSPHSFPGGIDGCCCLDSNVCSCALNCATFGNLPGFWTMFRTQMARIGTVIFGTGILLLAVSFFLWQRERPGLWSEYSRTEWVRSEQSDQPAVAEDEIWRFSQVCYRPYVSAELVPARAKLAQYRQNTPAEIRTAKEQQHSTGASDSVYGLVWFQLRGKYRQWFTEEDRLAGVVQCWEERLDLVGEKDIELVKGRLSQLDQESPQSAFLQDTGRLPGSGFCAHSETTEGEIVSKCLQRIKIKSIVTNTVYFSRLPNWPERQPYLFWSGVSLMLAGIVIVPIFYWVRSAPR